MVVLAIAGACSGDDGDRSSATNAGTATSSSTTPETTAAPAADDAEAVIAELTSFVEEARGVDFREPAEVELVDDEEFERRILADLEGDRDELATVEPRFRALGLIEPDTDLYEAFRTLLGSGVVGFYDPETKELVVRGTELSAYAREVVVHELTHALDDQHFAIDDRVAPWSDDAGLAVLSAIEGSAERVRAAYAETLSNEEQDASMREQLGLAGDDLEALLALPRGLIELLGVPYQRGVTFSHRVVQEADVARLNDTLAGDPPLSMEQILHPEAYLEEEPVVPVDAPAADGEVVEEGVLGEHYLLELLGGRVADEAAEGWGGDRFVAWREGTRSCLRAAVATDSPGDHDELAAAAEAWAADSPGRDVAVAAQLVTLTSCA